MRAMRDHRKLKAFDALVVSIYEKTRVFPRDELFGLTSQMRRAAVSVVANIVEGSARDSEAEYLHFLNMAFGSLREVGYYIDLASRLGYLPADVADDLNARYDETARVLSGLIQSFRPASDIQARRA